MDFVSAHGGAIPPTAWAPQGQFTHPLVVRAKLEIASACHAHGKVPSHCVVTEFNDIDAHARRREARGREFGYTRMWSIHPDQIRPILEAFAPDERQIQIATKIIAAAAACRLGAGQLRWHIARPRELPLFLAGAGAGACHRPRSCPPKRRRWFAARASS